MKSTNLRQNILFILAFSALASILCTFVTGFGILYWGRTSSLEHTANEAKIIGSGEVPKFVSGLLLSDEFGGVSLLAQRIKERYQFDSVEVQKSLDVTALGRGKSQNCESQASYVVCLDPLKARFSVAVPISIPERTLGWILISGHDRSALDLRKLIVPIGIPLVGFLLSTLVSGFLIWRYIGNTINDALLRLTKSAASDSANSSSAIIPKFAIEELNVLGTQMQMLLDRLQQSRANEAIGRMTQMLAHDVRKPFSILKMVLNLVNNARDMNAVRATLERVTPEVDRAVKSVSGLIDDVMEVGSSEYQLMVEPVPPESLIDIAVSDLCRVFPKLQSSFQYDLRHTHMANVHAQKVTRVFSNILNNAAQAMNFEGSMWFSTAEIKEDGKTFVQFCIGNSGSFVAEQNREKLFDAFFTSGKKNGTGLGLAIAKKVVAAHGGKIWCRSSKSETHPKGEVEFFFTLPAHNSVCTSVSGSFPKHSREVTGSIVASIVRPNLESGFVANAGEAGLERAIIDSCGSMGRPIGVLIVDDETVYRQALTGSLGGSAELSQSLVISQAENAEQAKAILQSERVDLVITDNDLGVDSISGVELAGELRKNQGFSGAICLHSNHVMSPQQILALGPGRSFYVPKPISRAELLKLVVDAASKRN